MFSLQHYNYTLPEKRIAQKPSPKRDCSRLLWLRRNSGEMSHHRFKDLTELLLPTDLLVVNNTKVIPARLEGKKETGGQVEVLILKYPDGRAGNDIGIENKQWFVNASSRLPNVRKSGLGFCLIKDRQGRSSKMPTTSLLFVFSAITGLSI